jgi:hypothetical protein
VFSVEKGICLSLLRGSEISRYNKPDARSVVIFPYSVEKGSVSGMSLNQLKEEFPKAYSYLLKNKKRLLERSKTNESNWWLYPYPKNLGLYAEQKIVCQVLSQSGKFFHDDSGKYCFLGGGTAGGNAIKLKLADDDFAALMLAILNSKVTAFYVSSVGSAFRGGFFAFGKSSLQGLPIPELDKNSSVAKKIITLVKRRLLVSEGQKLVALEAEIDEEICKLYGIKKRELDDVLGARLDAAAA